MQMKNGFNSSGAEIKHRWAVRSVASRVRRSMASRIDNWSVYGAPEGVRRQRISQFLGIGDPALLRRCRGTGPIAGEFHLNVGVCQEQFWRVGSRSGRTAAEILGGHLLPTPQTTDNRVAYANLTGKVEVTPTWTIDGSRCAFRAFRQKTVDGNLTEASAVRRRCDALLCFNEETTPGAPANGLNGVQLANPFPPARCWARSIDNHPFDHDRGDAAGNQHRPALSGHNNQFMVGTSFDPASPASGRARNWARSAQITSSAAAASSLDHQASRFQSVRSRFAPPTATLASMRSTRST